MKSVESVARIRARCSAAGNICGALRVCEPGHYVFFYTVNGGFLSFFFYVMGLVLFTWQLFFKRGFSCYSFDDSIIPVLEARSAPFIGVFASV